MVSRASVALGQVREDHLGSLTGEKYGGHSANPGITAGNPCHLVEKPLGATISGRFIARPESILGSWPGVSSDNNRFMLDRQGHLSIYHEKLGLIVTGANSKHQPELATFLERTKDRVSTIPLSSQLRMSDERDRLGLGYSTRLVWPVLPFNPYRNAPEKELRYAVGVLSVPARA